MTTATSAGAGGTAGSVGRMTTTPTSTGPTAPELDETARIARDLPQDKLDAMIHPARIEDLPGLGQAILRGGVQGRVVVDLS